MSEKTEVLYNGDCPVCSREVRQYQRMTADADLPIEYFDLNDREMSDRWQINSEDAARRLHVRQGRQTYAGVPAFIVLWREIPRLRWLARIVSVPGVHWMACKIYDHVLAPLLFSLHKRRQMR